MAAAAAAATTNPTTMRHYGVSAYWAEAEQPALLRQHLFEQRCWTLYAAASGAFASQVDFFQGMQRGAWGL